MIIVDAHVHLHPHVPVSSALDAALHNFYAHANRLAADTDLQFVIALTESAGVDRFGELAICVASGIQEHGSWRIGSTNETNSLLARGPNGEGPIVILAGRQIVTRERVEIIALASRRGHPDGESVYQYLAQIAKDGGLPVIPWGFGKWLGKRGVLVEHLISTADSASFFLGDNGGRLALMQTPRLLEMGQRRGLKILPGTDPLPFPGEHKRIGSYGFWLEGKLSLQTPGDDLKVRLGHPDTFILPYGKLMSPMKFLVNQIRMQIRKKGQALQ
jgi:hypothetical protein